MKFFTLPALLAVFASAAVAQTDPSNNSRSALQDELARAPAVSASTEDGGNFDDLVIAKYAISYHTFVLNDLEYQTNADLAGDGGESSFVWLPTVGASVLVDFDSPFSITSTVAAQAGKYTDVANQDFIGVNANFALNYELTTGLVAYAGPELYDYKSLDGLGELSRGFAPGIGLRYSRKIIDSRTQLFGGVRYQHHYVSPSIGDRDVWSANVGVTRQLSDNFYAQGFFEYRYLNYSTGGREDRRNTFGAALVYVPTAGLRMSTGLTFVDNDSNNVAAEFKTYNIGLGSTLSWQF